MSSKNLAPSPSEPLLSPLLIAPPRPSAPPSRRAAPDGGGTSAASGMSPNIVSPICERARAPRHHETCETPGSGWGRRATTDFSTSRGWGRDTSARARENEKGLDRASERASERARDDGATRADDRARRRDGDDAADAVQRASISFAESGAYLADDVRGIQAQAAGPSTSSIQTSNMTSL
jgi:hypothetical protein